MKKLYFTLAFAIGLIMALGGCSQSSSSENSDKKVVKVALSDEVNPPFLFTNDQNEPVGYDMDYLKQLEKKLPEYKFEYTLGEEETNLVGVSTGKYDFAINWFFKNPEREEKFLYPAHEYGYSLTALVTQKSRNDIKTLDDMADKKFPPVSATGGLRAILNAYNKEHATKPLTLESIDNPSTAENLKLVDKGKADAIFLNVTTFNEVQKQLKLNLKIGGIVSKEPTWLVFNKNNQKLADEIDKATVKLKNDGTLENLAEKWFKVNFFKDLKYINQQNFNFQD